jgi:hypothetical protein
MKAKGMWRVFIAVSAVAVCSMFAIGTKAAPADEHVSLTGYLTCTTCVLPNACHAQTRLGCTEWWTNQGAAYVLVAGDRRYRLAGDDGDLAAAMADRSVTVTGNFDGYEVAVGNVRSGSNDKM